MPTIVQEKKSKSTMAVPMTAPVPKNKNGKKQLKN